jgi:hypothetical protein
MNLDVETKLRNFISGNICFEYLVQCKKFISSHLVLEQDLIAESPWALPVGLFLTSFGWWESFVEEEAFWLPRYGSNTGGGLLAPQVWIKHRWRPSGSPGMDQTQVGAFWLPRYG